MEEEEKVSDGLCMTILSAQLGQSLLAKYLRKQSWRDEMRCECHLEDEL